MAATGRTRRALTRPLHDLDDLGPLGDLGGPGDAVPARPHGGEPHPLLRHHRWIELARIGEYARMGLLGPQTAERIRRAVLALSLEPATGPGTAVLPDPLPALEACVRSRLPDDARVWHADPVRDDVRACARLMRGRERLLATVAAVSRLSRTSMEVAARHSGSVMPGSPRRGDRPAQAMTFGFYLAALAEATAGAAESLQALFDAVNLCPLGSGAMTGLEAPWDRHRLAVALGFDGPQPHALTSAASGAWVLRPAGELSVLGTTLNRFLNDLVRWSGPGRRFVGLPDELSGPSPAGTRAPVPVVLEGIRDMTRHLAGLSYEIMAAQRDIGYADPDGAGREGGHDGHAVEELFSTCGTMLALLDRVVANLRFHPERASRAVREEPVAVPVVAAHLTLEHGVPDGTARAVVDAWASASGGKGGPAGALTPARLSASGLAAAGERFGIALNVGEAEVRELLDPEVGVRRKRTAGSTGPEQVLLLLEQVGDRLAAVDRGTAQRSGWLREAWEHTTGTRTGEAS
ncbi:hypothetical protein ACIBCT_30790 [Streptosporangium sp. NPDC050855]|uniref:hypothetical protein n=1 Tax=Streptosporangium sp. NPDC050855 TaxID=3366194 RepID=UPI0037957C24